MYPGTKNALEKINAETSERKLLALAYRCKADVAMGYITPEEYGECMLALAQKLGFGITPENLKRAAKKYVGKKSAPATRRRASAGDAG